MQPSAYDALFQRWDQRGVLAKPTQGQWQVRATFTQVWGLLTQMRVRP